MYKKTLIIFTLVLMFISLFSNSCLANIGITRRDFAAGWQFSRAANGLSVKIPIQAEYYLQPIFTISLAQKNVSTKGHYAVGLRGIYDLPTRQDYHPYVGVALGYSKSFKSSSLSDSATTEGGTGYEAFFGVEYQKYFIRPALEVSLGGFSKIDHSYYAGMTFNFSLLYYF